MVVWQLERKKPGIIHKYYDFLLKTPHRTYRFLLELIREFNKVSGYKINIQKLIVNTIHLY